MTPPLTRLCPALALMWLAPVWLAPDVLAQESSRRTVLAIHWGPEDFPPTAVADVSIRSALRADAGVPIDYFAEYLESDAFPAAAPAALAEYIRQKYRGRRIDVVIAVADPALRFALDHRDELFPGAPIVYSGVALQPDGDGGPARGLTGVLRGVAYAETLKLALALHPATEQVFVISRSPDRQVVDSVKAELGELSRRLPVSFVDQATVPGLIEAVKAVPPRSLIVFIFYSEARPRRSTEEEIARQVVAAAGVPVYATNERYIGTGVVGGVVRGTRETGIRLGELALAILRGARADDLPIEHARLVPNFDWRQVQRWGIDASRLPPGSIMQFRTPTAWESYRGYIIGTIVVVSAQTLLIAGLFAQRARRRHAEHVVRAREATLRGSYERSRLLAGKLINAEEATRAEIARDLHDGVCQDLIGISMAVARLKRSSGQILEPHTQHTLSTIHDDTRDVCETLRRLSHDLHPTTLQLVGLASALKAHCIEVEQRHGVPVQFEASGEFTDIRPDVVVCLFRITQESLHNAVVHGDASRLAVSLARSDGHIELTVTDDGRGFDVEAVRSGSSGLGLVSMEERARAVGADVDIVSGAGQGTTIRVRGPAVQGTLSQA
jgi:signal transduction histidine kinase